jgi:hypothetical protein
VLVGRVGGWVWVGGVLWAVLGRGAGAAITRMLGRSLRLLQVCWSGMGGWRLVCCVVLGSADNAVLCMHQSLKLHILSAAAIA